MPAVWISKPKISVLAQRRMFYLIVVYCLLLPGVCQNVMAERRPLLLAGKTSLYQRILTRPGALLYSTPGGKEIRSAKPLPPLSIFFVYGRKQVDSREWLEVGAASQEPTDGWLPDDKAIDWKQTLTVSFTIPANRDLALFFRDQAKLEQLLQSPQALSTLEALRRKIKQGNLPADFPVIAMEPSTYVDPTKHFYLLPILNFDEIDLESGYSTQLFNVAAVTLQAGEQDDLLRQTRNGPARQDKSALLKNYHAGIVFVIDTTTSMGPYLNRTREAIHRIYQRLKQSNWGRNVSFGLVAFRNNIDITPGLDYVAKTFATLEDGRDEATFFAKVNQAAPAQISSHQFNEDVYAGIFKAIEEFDWSGYDGRFIVLITDAGAVEGTDPLSQTHLNADGLRIRAQEKEGGKIAIYALHLLTPAGRDTHELAASQYQTLTHWGNVGPLYFGVEAGSVTEFGKQVDTLAASLVQQVADASSGKLVEVPAVGAAGALEQKIASVGRAMQLAYLGRAGETEAPRLIDAWVADRDPAQPTHKTLEVRVLITKNQLSDLQQTLKTILEAGERTRFNPKEFFTQVLSVAARMSRRPETVSIEAGLAAPTGALKKPQRLGDLGLVDEWLEGLPYKSKIMKLTEPQWLEWSISQQREFLDELEEKILLYQRFHDDLDRWVTLDAGRVKGDAVCLIPIDILP